MAEGNSEVDVLLSELRDQYGYDLSEYSRPSLERRIARVMTFDSLGSIEALRDKLKNKDYVNYFIEEVTVNVTEMFRDVAFFKTIRETILPRLATYPYIRIWHAGCSTGEEIYSMAILLEEAGLMERTLLYATDINESVLEKARNAKYHIKNIEASKRNYQKAGGTEDFNKYFKIEGKHAYFTKYLGEKVVYAMHNLVTDKSFNEFNLIVCHNVLIYFNKNLQNKVIGLFYDSLAMFGYLSLSINGTLTFSPHKTFFRKINNECGLWQKTN